MKRGRSPAAVFNDLAGLFAELAVIFGDTVDVVRPLTKVRTERRPSLVVRPEGESDELSAASARRILRERGFAEVKR